MESSLVQRANFRRVTYNDVIIKRAFPLGFWVDGPLVFAELCLPCDETNTGITAVKVGEEAVEHHYSVKDVKGETV